MLRKWLIFAQILWFVFIFEQCMFVKIRVILIKKSYLYKNFFNS
jgi:hypothetical protein